MTYCDWREELILTEGAKTRIVIKGLRKLGFIKKPKIKKASGMLPDIDPDLFAQFPGVNYRKLIDPNYKANRNPKLAKAIKIFKDKLERAKIPSSSPYSTYAAPKVSIKSPVPPKVSQQIKSNLSKGTKLTDDQKKKNFADYVKSLTKKVKDKNKVKKNLKTYEGDNKYYPPEIGEEVMAAPTNSMGGGAIAGSVEAGDNPPVRKKKRYIYGGRGSRKMWMNNK